MTGSQYAVMRFEVKSMVMLPGEPLLFDSLAKAEQYSKTKIAADPKSWLPDLGPRGTHRRNLERHRGL